ncbi:MAG TPA: hypothetical protein DEA52_05285 [Clostridiaceae bacterium]|nr:hypothetical protein [Clostridiaceae bacterium]
MQNIGVIKTTKFKNNAISLVVPVSLSENITGYNVLAQLMKRGTKNYGSSSEISRYLQDLYGAVFDIALNKVGEKLFVIFYIGFLDNRFTLYKEDLWDKAIAFLNEIIYAPAFIEDDFDEDILAQELENHRMYVESVYDDKGHYSMGRVMEMGLMDSVRHPEYGYIKDLEGLTKDVLIELWEALKKKPAFCYASGNITKEEKVQEKLSTLAILNEGEQEEALKSLGERSYNRAAGEVYETMKVQQGKMSLLYNANASVFQDNYFALVLFNSIFGGGAHSKLFNEVREKHSLAYSIYSTFDKFSGVMTIGAGVDYRNFEKVKNLIDEELQKMRQGIFTDQEVSAARTKIKSSLRSMEDSMFSMSSYLTALRVFGISYTVEDVMKGIDGVTKEEIIAVAGGIEYIAGHYLQGEVQNDND